MNKVHEIFPLVIYQDSIECHEEFKKENIDLPEKVLVQWI